MIAKKCGLLLGFLMSGILTVEAQSRTTLSAEVYGYRRDMVYFDCIQSPFFNAEFHTNPGDEHLYTFESKAPVCMLINGQVNVLLVPGDSVHAVVKYDEKRLSSVVFSGTAKAVAANSLLRNIGELRQQMRYKSQLLACVVVDVKPQQRIADSRTLLSKVQTMVEKDRKQLSAEAADYILAATEAAAYTSYMEYPQMYADTRKTPITEQGIGDYWQLMNGVKLRKGVGALSCPEYVSFLMRYCFYENQKKAVAKGESYAIPQQLEEMYKQLAAYYDGTLRDATLYQLLVNFIRNGKETERALPLYAEYKAKYNIDKTRIDILNKLLQ
ncbi:hypothetical protein [Hoylesella enoeca]|uniref:DUF4369 domain-containing protein n=1 Tax=Hoylesella enoeca TaxID=76123 RepID=A0A0S2KNB1_9BACT|nr:hypothetical protein [Hoylesella enoeca]ALO49556.1 hypothetical protein AS203_11080 [Hoylesella enoeca]